MKTCKKKQGNNMEKLHIGIHDQDAEVTPNLI